jgi:hypothetical protein
MGRAFATILIILLALSSASAIPRRSACLKTFTNFSDVAPSKAQVLTARPGTNLGLPTETRIATYNIGLLYQDLSADGFGNWSSPLIARRMRLLGSTIKNLHSDIFVITESGSLRVLEYINRVYLNGEYDILTQPTDGIDERLDVGFLIRKDIGVRKEFRHYNDWQWLDPTVNRPASLFRQGLAMLTLRDVRTGKPLMFLAGLHMKSQRHRYGDPTSHMLRQAQTLALLEMVRDLEDQHRDSKTPVLLAGDFNFDLALDVTQWDRDLLDVLDFDQKPVPNSERSTHIMFGRFNQRFMQQLDGILMGKQGALPVLSARIVRPRAINGGSELLPRNRRERREAASDHFPLVTVLDTAHLR